MPRLSAARALVLSWLVGAALLLVVSLVGWGGLLLASAFLQLGPRGVARVFLPRHPSFWAWLNAGAAALAVVAVLAAAGIVLWIRAGRARPPAA